MSNILNEPQSDAFEDRFFKELELLLEEGMNFEIFPKGMFPRYIGIQRDAIKYCVDVAHRHCGGESGDEPYEYGMELVNDFLTTSWFKYYFDSQGGSYEKLDVCDYCWNGYVSYCQNRLASKEITPSSEGRSEI